MREYYYDQQYERWMCESSDEDEGGINRIFTADPKITPVPLNPVTDPVTWAPEVIRPNKPYLLWQSQRSTQTTLPQIFSWYTASVGSGVVPTTPRVRLDNSTNPLVEYQAPRSGAEIIFPYWFPHIQAQIPTNNGQVAFEPTWRSQFFEITLDISNVPEVTTSSERFLMRVHNEDSTGPNAVNVIHSEFIKSPSQNTGAPNVNQQTIRWQFSQGYWQGQAAQYGPGLRHMRVQISKGAPYVTRLNIPIISISRPWNPRITINFYSPREVCKNENSLVNPRWTSNPPGFINWVGGADNNVYELLVPAYQDPYLNPVTPGDNLNMPKICFQGGMGFTRPDNSLDYVIGPASGAGVGTVFSMGANGQPILATLTDEPFDKFPTVKWFWRFRIRWIGFGDVKGIFSVEATPP